MNLHRVSIDMLLSNQAASGAFPACPSFPTYRYSWLRDGSFIAYALDRVGEHAAARRFHRWAAATVVNQASRLSALQVKLASGRELAADDFLPARYLMDGTVQDDDWPNFQLDGYGAWLWGFAAHLGLAGDDGLLEELGPAVSLILDYLRSCWRLPCFDCWEEHGNQVHTSTLACLAGGMGSLARHTGDRASAVLAAEIRSHLLSHGVSNGRLTKFCGQRADRMVRLPDARANSPASVGREVDASLLWAAVPFGVLDPSDPVMANTVAEIERTLTVGGGVRRYARDTYYGGGLWLLLSAWLGWYYCRVGRVAEARSCLAWIEAQADEAGRLPEQVSESLVDPACLQPWVDAWGPVAKPLLWSHAMYLVLYVEIAESAGRMMPPCTSDAGNARH